MRTEVTTAKVSGLTGLQSDPNGERRTKNMNDNQNSSRLTRQSNVLDPAQAWEAMVGESRLNWIRMAAIALFYLQHAVLFFRIENPTPSELRFHTLASLIVIVWGGLAAFLQLLPLKKRPGWIAYLATSIDLILVTVLVIASPGGGPFSTLLVLYPGHPECRCTTLFVAVSLLHHDSGNADVPVGAGALRFCGRSATIATIRTSFHRSESIGQVS